MKALKMGSMYDDIASIDGERTVTFFEFLKKYDNLFNSSRALPGTGTVTSNILFPLRTVTLRP